VLDGELAVPCNLKSAHAGLNSDGWVLLSLMFIISGVDSLALRNSIDFKPVRSGKKQR